MCRSSARRIAAGQQNEAALGLCMLDHSQLNDVRCGDHVELAYVDRGYIREAAQNAAAPHLSMLREANITDARILPAGIKFITGYRLGANSGKNE
jgi:hypothetical protein